MDQQFFNYSNNQHSAYSSTFKQKKKSQNDTDINDKINAFNSMPNFNNYSHDTLFEAYPVNTRISTRDKSDNSILLPGATLIPNGNINSSEFFHNQHLNSYNVNKKEIKRKEILIK